MLDQPEYSRWLEAAVRTLGSAEGDRERGDYNWACFKAQQAAELAVKGLFYGIGRPVFGHSVAKLLERLQEELGAELPPGILECGKLLDKLYIPTRYPDAWSEGPPHYYYTQRDADRAIECARSVIEWVKGLWRRLSSAVAWRGSGS
ncbi:HEPN domain-containing protein [Pyrodictium abyssi]|uniref:HEPN domain-containing protein n=1 Tax=Pyrodictium abyssi TaxID=54256 RepID=A0ABM8IVP1_9CREN|nr:HEPN domain-containing protein [Pyrodictium abyssi]